MKNILLSILFLIQPVTNPAIEIFPMKTEELKEKVILPNCNDSVIVEWKASKNIEHTKFSNIQKNIILTICEDVFTKYPIFIKKKFDIVPTTDIKMNFSFLPANQLIDGKEFRNLNDNKFRFSKHRPKDDCCLWGQYFTRHKWIFVRNDAVYYKEGKFIINKFFTRTVAHEITHALNHQSGVKNKYLNSSTIEDENLVEEFLKYAGYSQDHESVEENKENLLRR